jgi:hypothetical protein
MDLLLGNKINNSRKPFDNEDYKVKTKQMIANKKDPVTGYRAIENFAHFRGRIHRKFDVKIVDKGKFLNKI